MNSNSQSNKNPFGRLNVSNEFLGVIVGIIMSIITLLTQTNKTKEYFSAPTVLIFVDLLNMIVLLLVLVSIKATELSIDGQETEKVERHIKIKREQHRFQAAKSGVAF